MAKLAFTKMHGIGNDYIYVDCTQQDFPYDPAAVSRALSPRHFAVGADGLVLILPSHSADFKMRIFNADGSEASMCGNASRCVAKYVRERSLTDKKEIRLETLSGVKTLRIHPDAVQEGIVAGVTVDVGVPNFATADLPARVGGEDWIDRELDFGGYARRATLVTIGNPHAVMFFDEDIEGLDLPTIGPAVERSAIFPERINAEFARVLSRKKIAMRVWERGSGETMACGTGACAVAVAAAQCGYCDREVRVHLPGGDLQIAWNDDGHVYMTGPAAFVCDGTVDDSLWL